MGGRIFGTFRHRFALTLLISAAAFGCGRRPPAGGALGVVDDAGAAVSLAAPARRVVSLVPATTELLFAIGAGDRVAGRTAWCDYPPAALEVQSVGDGISPNVEAVLARRPDLVVLYNSARNAQVAARLREAGVAAVRLNTDRLADVARVARLLGRLTGRERSADSLTLAFDSAMSSRRTAAGPEPRVLLLVWEQPPMTVGRGSFLSELVERAGGRNLFADLPTSSGPVSIEAVAARDPDLVLTTADGPTAFATRPEWQSVRAVRERRFVRVQGSEFSRPSPRAPEAVRQLTALLRRGRPGAAGR